MNIFWKNVTRYPRFLITSVSGSIIIILTPFLKALKRNTQSFILTIGLTILFILSLIYVLSQMLDL